jgi:hypothetical protein
MNGIIKLLFAIGLLLSLDTSAETLQEYILKAIPNFCHSGTWPKKTIRSRAGLYCTSNMGAAIARYVCGDSVDLETTECGKNKKSMLKYFRTVEDAKKTLEEAMNKKGNPVCSYLDDNFEKIIFNTCSGRRP